VADAADGEQALAAAHRVHPDAALVDVKLPDTHGLALHGGSRRRAFGAAGRTGRPPTMPVAASVQWLLVLQRGERVEARGAGRQDRCD